ncbi:MAG TPA: hypothetical protein PK264_09405 [Hyphomicrobiaceae bacterium]|nr:hypothetical protein [Hyphomicrobiaceae bacterium]
MADGSGKPEIVRRAEAAAAEAASEAKAEVLADENVAPPAKARRRPHAEISATADPWHRFVLDVWITNLNSVEFGFYKHSRNKAKSRQFTSDMDIFAEIVENGERTGLLGYREDLWSKNTGMDKRLVLKLFGERLNWHATMDLMIGRSLQLTLGARGLPVVAYSANVGNHDHMVYLERSANKWPLMPENFSFFLMDEGKPEFYRLKRRVIDLGGDYALIDQHGREIGGVDGRLLSLGGKWKGRILREHADKNLLLVLKLFCGMLIFNRSAKRHLARLARDVMSGRYDPKLEKQEADLYMNPRRVR